MNLNLSGALNLPMGKVEGVSFGVTMDGHLAIKTKEGNFQYFDDETERVMNASGMAVETDSVFIMPVPVNQLKKGDIISSSSSSGKIFYSFREYKNNKILGVNLKTGENVSKQEIVSVLFGTSFVGKVFSPLTMMKENTGMNPFMLMALMDEKKGNSMEDMLPLLLLSGGMGNGSGNAFGNLFGSGNGFNPVMLLLMKDKGGMSDLLPLMMLSGAMSQPQPSTPAAVSSEAKV